MVILDIHGKRKVIQEIYVERLAFKDMDRKRTIIKDLN